MKKNLRTPLAAAMGVAFISSFTVSSANAEANPFGVTELASGYMQLAEAKTGEMTCGANMKMDGASTLNNKAAEGACASKTTSAAASTKSSEGKCGNMMDGDKMKKGMEAACGAMMKGKEGACGAMMQGESMKGKEGACGAGMKMPEGKCASQCGEGMKSCPDVKTTEGACGANMKGCGEAMQGCGEMMKGKEGACAATMKAPAADVAKPAVAPAH